MNLLLPLLAALLVGAATESQAQSLQPNASLPPLRATLDTVAVTGTTRVLTLATVPGPEVAIRALSPGKQTAVFYAPPAGLHEYDVTAIRILVSEEHNLSSSGHLLVSLVWPDSSTQAPSQRLLMPAPLLLTDREVRRAKNGVLTLDVRPYRITMPAAGLFVVAEGIAEPPYRYLGDTLLAKGLGHPMPSMHARLINADNPGRERVVNVMDFICIRDIRTTSEPQTWDYRPKQRAWVRRKASYPNCPKCLISNAGLELVVKEL